MRPQASDDVKNDQTIELASENDDFFGVELHNHLFGAVRPSIIYDAAKRKNILPPNVNSLEDFLPYVTAPEQCEDLLGFIKIIWYYLPIIAGDKIALKELAIDYCKQQYESKIFYSETRYTPWEVLGDQNSNFSLTSDQVMNTIISGLEEGCRLYGIRVRSLLSVLCEWNGDNDPRCIETLEIMKKYKYNSNTNKCGVVGIDIAGNEAKRIQENIIFDKTFQTAKKMGFHCTVHAGEAGGADSVKYAITNMCAERIGHGYRTIQSKNILNMVKMKNKYIRNDNNNNNSLSMIHFECCPTSSVCTNSVVDYKRSDKIWLKHPIRTFVKENIHFSLSTDDPMVFQTDMAEEIDVARNKLGMSWREIGDCDIRGMEAAFIDDQNEKQKLIDIVTKRVNLWVKKQEDKDKQQLLIKKSRGDQFRNIVFGVATVLASYVIYRKLKK